MNEFEFELLIPKMHCVSCSGLIEDVLRECKKINVIGVSADTFSHTVTVKVASELDRDLCIEELKNVTARAEYPTEMITDLTPSASGQDVEIQQIEQKKQKIRIIRKTIRNLWVKGILGVLSGAAIMALAISGVGIPLALGVSVSAFTLLLGRETYQHAVALFVNKRKLTMESLFTVSTLLAVGVSVAAFFVPWLPMMFDAALFILGFKNIGKAIEESANQKLETQSFQSLAPTEITVELAPKRTQKIPVKNLLPGNIIVVCAGERVPVDGVCLDVETSIDESDFTGNTLPQQVKQNQPILAGVVVPMHVKSIRVRVTHDEKNSELVFKDKGLERVRKSKASWQTTTQKILQYFIPTVFGIAAISALVTGLLISPVAAIQCAISVLVSACPCILGLVTPFAIRTGIMKAAKHNIFFKEADSIEKATKIDTVVFDLNGTLTTGIHKVVKSTVPREFLAHLLKIEKQLAHSTAKAICDFVEAQEVDAQEFKRCEVNPQHDGGLTAELGNDDHFVVGNEQIMRDKKIETKEFEDKIGSTNEKRVVYVAKGKQIVGYLLLTDPLRDDAVATVRELQRQGKAVHICTGASQETAEKYAKELGIPAENITANCRSETRKTSAQLKTKYIEKLQRENQRLGRGGVAAIGDSGNDAEMVVKSDFSVAVKSAYGSRITQYHAEAIINQNSLWSIVHTFAIAKQTVANIKQNLALSVGYNLLSLIAFSGLLVALGLAVNPALGALLMIVQTGLVLLNVARFKHQSLPAVPDSASVNRPAAAAENWESTDATLQKGLLHKASPACSAQPSPQRQTSASCLSWLCCFSSGRSSSSADCQKEIESAVPSPCARP